MCYYFALVSTVLSFCAGAAPSTNPSTFPVEAAGIASGGLSLRIRASKPEYSLGEAVEFTVMLRNESDHPIGILRAGPYDGYQDFDYDVRQASGEAVTATRFGKRLYDDYLSLFNAELQPGDALEHTLKLNVVRDLSTPGVYKISLSWRYGNGSGKPASGLSSNVVNVRVKLSPSTQPKN